MFFINPFIYAGGGDFESIETVTLSNSNTATLTFSSLGTYQHLQIRGLARNTRATTGQASTIGVRFNSDTGNNYAHHRLRGTGSAADAGASSSVSRMALGDSQSDSATANIFTAFVMDILDFASTSKAKTVRSFWGADTNGGGSVAVASGLWTSTSAVTSVTIYDADGYNFVTGSTFALYGIKAP